VWYISLDESSVTCIATLDDEKHNGTPVTSVAFHPNAPLLATGCHDGIANLWRLPHNSEVTCVGTIHVGVDSHTIVAFHPTEPLLAISVNREGLSHCVKLWR
jgi:WD40 repeat protein